jgi:hypothetical protein
LVSGKQIQLSTARQLAGRRGISVVTGAESIRHARLGRFTTTVFQSA